MPSIVDTAKITPTLLSIGERENAVAQAKSLTIDNQVGAGDCEITIQDSFNESAYYGDVTLAARLVERFKVTVVAGDIITWGEEDLKGVKCLGAMNVISDVDKATCPITVGYEHE